MRAARDKMCAADPASIKCRLVGSTPCKAISVYVRSNEDVEKVADDSNGCQARKDHTVRGSPVVQSSSTGRVLQSFQAAPDCLLLLESRSRTFHQMN